MSKEELIANYFLNTLSGDDRRIFDDLLKNDPDFASEIEFQKQVKHAVAAREHDVLKQKLQYFESQMRTTASRIKWWLAAASIVFFVSIGYYIFNNNVSNIELFNDYYQPAQNIVQPIVRSAIADEKTAAFIAYQKGDYKMAQQLFNTLYQKTQDSELLFYEGISLIETNDLESAINKLELHSHYSDAVSNKTNWYLALAYIKQNNLEKAKTILMEITTKKESYKYREAKMLIKKL